MNPGNADPQVLQWTVVQRDDLLHVVKWKNGKRNKS
jgi:hypothetical protein